MIRAIPWEASPVGELEPSRGGTRNPTLVCPSVKVRRRDCLRQIPARDRFRLEPRFRIARIDDRAVLQVLGRVVTWATVIDMDEDKQEQLVELLDKKSLNYIEVIPFDSDEEDDEDEDDEDNEEDEEDAAEEDDDR